MRSLHSPVPSSTLLRFLKSQSESICFFSPNPRPDFTFEHAAPRISPLRARSVKTPSNTRRLSTSAPRRATVEAGFLNLDFLWPRSVSPGLNSPVTNSNGSARNKRLVYGGQLCQRAASTGPKAWHQKLWGVTSLRSGRPLRPDDLPATLHWNEEDSDTSMFSLGRHISAKAAAQPKLRCTEFDENGNVVLASGEFKKSELIAKVLPSAPFLRPPHKAQLLMQAHLIVRTSSPRPQKNR